MKFTEKVAHGLRKKPLDFSGNSHRVTLEFGLGRVRVTIRWGHRHTPHGRMLHVVSLIVTICDISGLGGVYALH